MVIVGVKTFDAPKPRVVDWWCESEVWHVPCGIYGAVYTVRYVRCGMYGAVCTVRYIPCARAQAKTPLASNHRNIFS